MRRRIRELIGRARTELEQAEAELLRQTDDSPDQARGCDPDLIEIRARNDALEARVAAIERQRG